MHPAPRRATYALMALFAIALAWACIGQVDIVAVVAPGRLIVSERTKVVQPLERSVVRRILVQDGDHVQAGQALVELDPTSAQADSASLQETLKTALSEALRSQALLHWLSSDTPSTDEKRGAIFPVTLQLQQTTISVDGKPIKLAPGMNVTAEIKTGRRRVIAYLLSPIQRAGSESLRER